MTFNHQYLNTISHLFFNKSNPFPQGWRNVFIWNEAQQKIILILKNFKRQADKNG